jgi:bifunctional DNA-binding transcriptional regulator/antitoxin component of YhaV-PrlF toxin-antitoxin module
MMPGAKRFKALLETDDGSTAFVKIPFDAKLVFGKARPPVRATLNGYRFQSTLTPYGGLHYLGINQKVRAAAGVKIGDRVEVTVEPDDTARTIKPPADLARALTANPAAKARWAQLSFTHQKEYVAALEDARKPETRARRIEKTIKQLAGEYHTRSKQA